MTKDELYKFCIKESMSERFSHALVEKAELFAKQQAIAFDKWKHENRWFSFENGYWYYTFEQGTSVSEQTYNKHYRKTPDELYSQFIEQQTN